MKKSIVLLLAMMLFISVYSQYTEEAFNMPTSNQIILNLNQTYKSDTSFVLNIDNTLYGLSVSGKCTLNTNKSFVRILLSDDCNNEHLVYENYMLIADSNVCDFSNIGIETSLLDSILPVKMQIQITDAELFISKINYTTNNHNESPNQIQSRRNAQNNAIATQLNKNLRKKNMTWRAGVTFVSSLSYEEKKTLFGTDTLPNLYGIEYYKGGVYVSPDYEYSSQEKSSSQYVDNFDWRNRHGKNWITPVKAQGSCWSCWAMAVVAQVEAYINLYYNRILNYDLSEQEIISCSNYGDCKGGDLFRALNYIKKNGVVLETCFPYVDYYYKDKIINNSNKYTLANCSDKCDSVTELIKIENYSPLNHKNSIDTIKSYLFKQPLPFSVYYYIGNDRLGHSMLMVGYKTIHTGDSLCKDYLSDDIIEAPEEMDGTTAYIAKNSWGADWGDNGYGYLVTKINNIKQLFQLSRDITSLIYKEKDQLYKDEDGDGYYTWGPNIMIYYLNLQTLGVPKQQDGDDSNAKYGPMDKYGHLMDLNPDNRDTTFITESTNWNSKKFIWQHVVVKDSGVLNVTSNIKCYKGVEIIVKNGGRLILDGGVLENVNLKILSGGEINVRNKGVVKKYKSFYTAKNAKVLINNGVVK